MFLVGGGILVHGIVPLDHAIERVAHAAGAFGGALLEPLLAAVVGIVAGAIVLGAVAAVRQARALTR
jgi:predicted DNA repair protein MutK